MTQESQEKAKYIVWSEVNSVGHPALDAEHRWIVEIINRLHSLVAEGGKNLHGLKKILDELVQYTHSHFFHEEAILQNVPYPDLEKHQAAHQEMRLKTEYVREQIVSSTGGGEALELLRFLRNWWLTHINRIDLGYLPYVQQK